MSIPNNIRNRARGLRKSQTPEENHLWQKLRNRKLAGLKFLRQHPIGFSSGTGIGYFIADFYCAEKKIVIEIDGPIHETQKDYDESRDTILKELGLSTLRIKNEELKDPSTVLRKIKAILLAKR